MKESELEAKFKKLVCQAGGKAYKFLSPGNDGVPDRLVVLPGGRIGFVELKQQGKKPGKLQQFRMKELEAMGCFTAVVDSEESALTVIGTLNAGEGRIPDRLFQEMINKRPGGRRQGT